MMRKIEQSGQRGVALIVVLVALGVATASLVFLFSSTEIRSRLGGMFRRGSILKLKAEAGFALATGDFLNRGAEENFSTYVGGEGDLEISTHEDRINAGLIPPLSGEVRTLRPRFVKEEGKIELRVYYFPDERNGGLDQDAEFPKTFIVVSQAKHLGTQEVFTMEGELILDPENWSEYTFALNHPRLPPGVDEIELMPSTFGGRVHFGLFEDENEDDDVYDLTKKIRLGGGAHETFHFKELVTFELDVPEEEAFDHGTALIKFKNGVRTGYEATLPSESEITDLAADAVVIPDDGSGDICLKFVDNADGNPDNENNDGKIARYQCSLSPANPGSPTNPLGEHDVFHRYTGEVLDRDSGNLNSALEIIDYPADGILYVDANVHVKGLVDGAVTIVTPHKLYLEGDIQYVDQDQEFSDDLVGLLAHDDIVIPYGVPMRPRMGEYYGQGDPENKPENNITNFIVENDRDAIEDNPETLDIVESSDYGSAWANPHDGTPEGWKNNAHSLDVDAIMMSVKGGLDVQGINDYETNDNNGAVIPAVDGHVYDLELADTESPAYPGNAYFFEESAPGSQVPDPGSGNWTRRADPIYCSAGTWYGYGTDNKCIMGKEVSRAASDKLWVFGGLILKDFTNTKNIRWLHGCHDSLYTMVDGVRKCNAEWNTATYNPHSGGTLAGFDRKVINADPRVSVWEPAGFPDSGPPLIGEIWTKQFRGVSQCLDGTTSC